jgi:predicted Zn-dependent protease
MHVEDYIPTSAGLELGDEGTDVERLQAYLRKYGYIDSPILDTFSTREEASAEAAPAPGIFDESTKRAVERFQEFAGIPVTGQLDDGTLSMMERPRCGFPDTANFVVDGRKWDHTDIKFSFRELTPDLEASQVRQAIKDAFGLWQAASSLTFREVGEQDNVDIVIRFVRSDHGDGDGFDGPGHVLAHAFFPPPNAGLLAGDAHFDDDESWSLDIPASGTDLITVAAHEFGHSLGLAHSQVQGALMFPFYDGPNRKLHDDDKAGIKQLYG